MTANINKKFDPKHLVIDKEWGFCGEPLSRPVKTQVLTNGKQKIELASIPKRNLSLGPYQRPEDKKRILNIRENFHEDAGIINVAEIKHKGKYYYTIPDGQHRGKAQPESSCPCVITNTLAEEDLFLLFNNPKCTKTTSKDDRFWASVYKEDDMAMYIVNYLKDTWDIELSRNTKENVKQRKFVAAATLESNLSSITKMIAYDHSVSYKDKESGKMKRKLTVSQATVDQEAKDKFQCLCEVMFGLFGTDSFYCNGSTGSRTAYAQLWGAMRKFLNSDLCNWMDSSAVIENLKKGEFSKKGLGIAQQGLVRTVQEYFYTGKSNWPQIKATDQLYHVILSIFKRGGK